MPQPKTSLPFDMISRVASCSARSSGLCSGNSTRPDWKSTRLNSSHLVISYAVFCLKKKKQYTSTESIQYMMHLIHRLKENDIANDYVLLGQQALEEGTASYAQDLPYELQPVLSYSL